jgi:alpha-L-fucosidase
MKRLKIIVGVLALIMTAGVGVLSGAGSDRAAWMDEAKFGMFIHWGIGSPLGQGEWVMHHQKMPVAEYAKLAGKFNPVKFNAEEWVKVAKNAGMKYIVITSKHHDGFAMFDTKVSSFNIVDSTPFKRDVMKELAAACKKQGIKLGFYYSQAQDWHHPGGAIPRNEPWDPAQAGDFQSYLKKISIPQIKELLTQYDPALIWFDTPWEMTSKEGRMIADAVRSTKPDTLMNSRLMYHGMEVDKLTEKQLTELQDMGVDYLSYRDRIIPENSPWPYWETCMTLNHSWGFNAKDENWKTPTTVIRQLVEIVSKGGTFLLNVGPTGEGVIPAESVAVLREVGDWLKVNGEAIYGAEPTSLKGAGALSAESLKKLKAQEEMAVKTGATPRKKVEAEMVYDWLATGKENRIYIHLFKWPTEPLVINGLKGEVAKAYLLADPEKTALKFTQTNGMLMVDLPKKTLDQNATVLCLTLK